jgi:hypothetical protein
MPRPRNVAKYTTALALNTLVIKPIRSHGVARKAVQSQWPAL